MGRGTLEEHFCESVLTHYGTFSDAAKMSWALRGGCGCCGSRYRKSGTISALLSRHGQQNLLLPAAEKPHRGLSAASLKSAASFVRARDDRRNNRTLDIKYREFCLQSSTLFSAGTVRSHRKKYDFSVKWVLGQIPNKPHRWENVPTDALLASL